MVAAGEIMWQNLEIDNTLKGGVANYFLDFANFEGLTKEELLDREKYYKAKRAYFYVI